MDRRLRALMSTALIVGAVFQAMNHVARRDEAAAWWDVLLLVVLAILIWVWDWLSLRFSSSEPTVRAITPRPAEAVAAARAAGAQVITDLKANPVVPGAPPPAPPAPAPVQPMQSSPAEAVAAAKSAGAAVMTEMALPLHYTITGVTDGEVMDDHTHDVMLVPAGGQALRRVDIDLDGTRQVSLIQPPYSYRLDGAAMSPGSHVLDFTVTGVSGDMERKRIHFIVPEAVPVAPPKPAVPPLAFDLTGVMEGERVSDDTRDVMLKLAADQASITRVDFDLDHERQVTLIQPPYSYRVDTAGLKPGNHSLYVTVTNSAGETRSVRRNFSVPEPILVPPPAPVAPPPAPRAAARKSEKDDLKLVEGIGPKFEKALNAVGILTFEHLAAATQEDLHAAVEKAGMRFAPSIPSWSAQAAYLVLDDHAGLAIFQGMLTAGRIEDPSVLERAPKPGTTPPGT
jgi:predicted flap endonuclease-1-like 5' DNA nuclease